MDLYVVRHAIAQERSPSRPDADRALTPKGKARFAGHVEALRRMEVRFTALLHSPWLRAAETAAMLAPLSDDFPAATDALARPPDERLLVEIARGGAVAVVGHEPWLSELVVWLATGRRDGAHVELKKGAVAHLRGAPRPGEMSIVALMPPRLLRAAGA